MDRFLAIAENIRACRVRAGKSAKDVAADLGINDAWYRDVEQHDDEMISTLSIFQSMRLASLLNVQLHELVGETAPEEKISLVDLPALVETYVRSKGISFEEFEEQVGWEVREFLRSPLGYFSQVPLALLVDLSRRLGLNWLSLVPEED